MLFFAIFGPLIYTALYEMILIRADALRGQVGGGRAHWGQKSLDI
jgi:hypothetical protein